MAKRCEQTAGGGEAGFSLIETLIAMAILATGLLSMAGVFIMGLGHLAGSSASLIAREKAREAVESVHTARDIGTIAWCEIQNAGTETGCADSAEGRFQAGAKPLRTAGKDGLVNTGDAEEVDEVALSPGPDNILGTTDDTEMPMAGYTREIKIEPVLKTDGTPNPLLRKVTVTVRYMVNGADRIYVLETFVSAIS
jgi:prepilin-type N-terminal cleavage/methylation domain-containing protein